MERPTNEQAERFLLKIYHLYRTEPIKFVGFLILCFITWNIYTQTDKILSYFPTPSYENEQFKLSIERDSQVLTTLEATKDYLSADAIIINQFHNGQYDLTNLPFTKITVTYQVGQTELSTEEIYATRPISSINRLMREVWKVKENPACLGTLVEDLKDPSFKQRLQKSGFVWVGICPITNILNYPIGYINIAYEGEPDNKELILDYLNSQARRISGYLQQGVVDGRRI